MEFVRQLEDSGRALRRMGPSHSNRLDNEDVIVMLMKKLPEESLKRKLGRQSWRPPQRQRIGYVQ
jgi:hypothetical protein